MLALSVYTLAAYADSISVEGETYDNVYVSETTSTYIVCFPFDGTMRSFAKEKVNSDAVAITSNVEQRRLIYEEWQTRRREAEDAAEERERKILEAQAEAIRQQNLEREQEGRARRDQERAEAAIREQASMREREHEALRQLQEDERKRKEQARPRENVGEEDLRDMVISWISLAIYLIPTFVAVRRKHKDTRGIVIVNLLTGCTVIGWFIALAWSLQEPSAAAAQAAIDAPPPLPLEGRAPILRPVSFASSTTCTSPDVYDIPHNVPPTNALSCMVVLGVLLLGIGVCVLAYFAMVFDVSVPVHFSGLTMFDGITPSMPSRVANLDRMNQRTTGVILGAAIMIVGAVFLGFGELRRRANM